MSYNWCLHCERVFCSDTADRCGYADCDGHFGDIWEWDCIRETHPSYPEIALLDKQYPL